MKRLAKDRLVTVFRRVTLTLILFVKGCELRSAFAAS